MDKEKAPKEREQESGSIDNFKKALFQRVTNILENKTTLSYTEVALVEEAVKITVSLIHVETKSQYDESEAFIKRFLETKF